ncbi:unnamed protein product [Rotaria magnacalcarata]
MVSSGTLNVTRAATYNYLVSIVKLPIVSGIIFTKGSVMNIFIVDGSTSDAAAVLAMGAITTTTTGQNALNGLTASSFRVDDVVYTSPSSNSSSSSSGGNNAGLIAGITVGVIAGVALIAGGVLLTITIFTVAPGQPLINNGPGDVTSPLTQPETTNGNTPNPSTSNTAPNSSNNNIDRGHTPLPSNGNGPRSASDLSATSTTHLFLSSKPCTTPAPNIMPQFELLSL